MNILKLLNSGSTALLTAPMTTRLKYDYHVKLDTDMSIFYLIKDKAISAIMANLYKQDIDIAQKHNLPIILSLPTYRASKYHINKHGFNNNNDVELINFECYKFVEEIRNAYPTDSNIFIAGSVGPKNNAYDPTIALDETEAIKYHKEQINALAKTNIDIINIVTMSGLPEALGCAHAAAKTHIPYTVGFVLDENAKLLDGTSLHQAISIIDHSVHPKPICYLLICTHPSIAAKAFASYYLEYDRVKGIKANGSCKSPHELSQLEYALADDPVKFANEVVVLKNKYNWNILGGCCGTNSFHLEAIAKLIRNL